MAKRMGHESKCQFDFRSLKVRNRPEIYVYMWCGIYYWKAINKGYNFALDLTSIGSLHKKLWPSKMPKVPILGIWDSQVGNPETK